MTSGIRSRTRALRLLYRKIVTTFPVILALTIAGIVEDLDVAVFRVQHLELNLRIP